MLIKNQILVCFHISLSIIFVKCDQVVLLDTTKEATLEWTRFPYGPQAQTPGWVEESFTNFGKGINWRSYVVCDVAYNNVNNWLWSPFIDRGPANRLYIEIHFTIRDCSLFPGNALSCKETFSLLFYEFDAATREPPPWQPESYKLIGRIAAGEGRFNQNSDVDINVEVKSIAVTKKGVYFAFRDQGACISILAVKVYYVTCPAITINFAHFNETPTGREVTIIEQQTGYCVENAEASEPPTYLCKGDGKWTILTGGCKCKVGYEADIDKQTCNVCPAGTFRSAEVNTCTGCPLNSRSNKLGSAYCKCIEGYYRHPRDGKHMPCYKPPGPPTNLTLLFIDQTSAILSWNPAVRSPSEQIDVKYRSNIVFKAKCPACSSNVVFNPSTDTFNDTKLTLTNLEPVSTYTVQIHTLNGISIEVNPDTGAPLEGASVTTEAPFARGADPASEEIKTEFAEITFTTESTVLSTVFNVKVISISSKEVELVWDKPLHSDSPIEFYEVRWFPKSELDAVNKSTLSTKESKIHITDLTENTEYGFQVRCKTINGFGTYSNIVYAQTHQSVSPVYDDNYSVSVIAGSTIVVIVIISVLCICAFVLVRSKNQDDIDKKTNNHHQLPLDYASNEVHAMDTTPIVKTIQNNVTTPLFGTTRSYVDPHTYDCWQKQRTHRPTFASIVSTLDNLVRQPQALIVTRNSPDNDRTATMESQCRTHNVFISVDLWLESIKMTKYLQHFKEADLVTAHQISRLTAQQLSDMGITLVGHQKKILHQARQLDTII
uniref:CSON003848 protein n=1 Tax=Culicoides sonorensis TaxID=179676 RepID=A0A336MPK1_CULSO